jgi:transcriptional antiterminator RfaH
MLCKSDVNSARAGTNGERWFVVHTRPHAESRAASHLDNQGYHTFYPRCRKTSRHARKTSTVLAPLFPRYLFVRFDLARTQWRNVNGTFGVARLVGTEETPLPVPEGVVEALRDSLGEEGILDRVRPFRIGQAVRITAGPFADLIGTLQQLDDAGRVRVLLALFGRSVSVALGCELLLPAA